ncbi:cell division protein FtsK [Exiguobacterium sp. U13-1]|uniref:DNA translocase FtsK n=1 Tax=Exiguobacterium acetylicum TaxID=41170 RepID=A0ABX8G5Y2_EXIAC|nr:MULTISPECIES: DNA translocase FtsK [Exiguobacterium]AOT01030.1 cell division protein FtsK [Exiguobacterium sp. U13-1]QWB28984.1 DNA translocase FtsK [Exiguobacterium acetylicum]HBQ77297.1 DNA translocase FtsK [Exiguobacterium sp.]HCD59604.1 DNA translocase FtsK [Exiguobacterium sp.]
MATTKRKPVRKKTPPRKRPAAKKQRQPIAYRTYATIIAIVSLLAFVLAFGEFGKVGLTLADGGERLIGQFGSLLYGGIGAVLLLLLSNASRAQKWAWSMLLMGSVVWIDLLLGAPRGILNGWLYQNAAYYISSAGAFLIGLFFIGTAVHILRPSFYGELWLGLRERAEEFRNRERTPRPRVEKELKAKPVREKKPKTLRPATVEEPIETEQEAEDPSVNIQDVPIIGFTDHVEPQAAETQGPLTMTETPDGYQLPSLDLLAEPTSKDLSGENKRLKDNATKLIATLKSFGIGAKVLKIHLGPSVTKYEIEPKQGIKLSRITGLADDLALALAAKDIRIEAPIPGKAAVGIEVPNREVAMVSLREVLGAESVQSDSDRLLVALGRSISGETVTAKLNKMPHVLVAGSTGSGKSVCINGMIVSILMRARPDEVRLMMIDPKMVELNVYNGIPHLLAPVVTDPKKAAQALKQVVSEMERRYEIFSQNGARNIEGYNALIDKMNAEEKVHQRLPYIVVIVDELADLMMVASNEVEDAIMRLAQMARAAGIHMVIATQRPSVDIITGVIKANIPSRIAFSVSSATDSRTILDTGGADKLLGRGDMLLLGNGMNKPVRVQGAFLSDEEVEKVVNHVISQQKAQYVEAMIPKDVPEGETEVDDPLYDEVVQFILTQETASTSMIQRKYRIGYNRAARLIDALEENGLIGPSEGSKPRRVMGR